MSFPPTRLSVVLRSRSDDPEQRRVAQAALVEAYWKPVYKYLRLKWCLAPDRAEDATQDFFVTVIERDLVGRYDAARSRFRTYLRVCLDGFAANQAKAERRLKRGAGVQPLSLDFAGAEGELGRAAPALSPEVDEIFYREWVRALFERAIAELRARSQAAGRTLMFDVFARYDLADDQSARPSYADLAREFQLTTTQVTNHLAAIRRELRAIVLEQLREITGSDEEWEAEARRLLGGQW